MNATSVPLPHGRLTHRIGIPGMSDLLKRISEQHDPAAYRELFQEFGPRIKTYMMRKGLDAQTAEDLAQDTLLMVWRKASLYSDENGNAASWIFTIARNLRIDRLRRGIVFQPLPDAHRETPSAEPSPETAASQHEIEGRVQQALAALPAEQREIVTLAYIDGLSQSDIARQLGLPLGTVKSRMRLAYQKVRTALEDLQ